MDRTTRIKLFTFLGIVLLLVGIEIVSALRAQYTVINFPPHGRTVVAFGDSLTEGVGASTPEHGFVNILAGRLQTPIMNMGVSGNTTADALARVEEVTAVSPNIVLLFLGGNDVLRKVPVSETTGNLRTIISTLQQHGALVILVGFKGIIGDGLNSELESLAKETGCLFVPDALDGILGNPSLLSDEVHPNDAGYQRLADHIAPMLEGALYSVASTTRPTE